MTARAAPLRVLGLAACAGLAACVSTPPAPVWHAVPAAALSRELSLEEALALARSNDVLAVDWAARRRAARAGLVTAASTPNPTVGLEWEGLALTDAGQSLASLKTGFSFPFLFFLPRPYEVAAAQSARAGQEQAERLERRRLAAEVGAAWFGLLADQRKVRIGAELSENAKAHLDVVRRGKEAGVRAAYDVERAEAEALEAEGDSADAESTLRLDQLAFAFALGADRPAFPRAIEPIGPAEVAAPAGGAELPSRGVVGSPGAEATPEVVPDELLAAALASDPSWAKARAAVSEAEADLHVQQMGAYPFTGVTGSVGQKGEPGVGHGGTGGLEIPIPIFDRNRGGIAKAEADLLAARAAEESARRAVVSDLAQDWERVRAASARLDRFARRLTEMRRKAEAGAHKLFLEGQIDQTEWLQARRDWKAAEKAEVDAWKDAAVARFALETALGQHDPVVAATCEGPRPPDSSGR